MIKVICDRCGAERELGNLTTNLFPPDSKYSITKLDHDNGKNTVINLCPNCEAVLDFFLSKESD